ncbi:hypothetical protein [Undibacterium sp. Ji22W]|uniref:hypothetical protein n=1 Tax=Undibacterium sp. Ji22W TaxID=3413038 RepID=UPI003BF22C39
MNTQNHGSGGSYVIGEDGARKLVERTKEAHDQDQQPEQAQPAEQNTGTQIEQANIGADEASKANRHRPR